jgi:cytochrome c5
VTDPERIALAEEAHDLAIHVQMCAMRHSQILARIDQADEAAKAWRARIEKGVWALIAMVGTGLGAGFTQLMPLMQAMAGQ